MENLLLYIILMIIGFIVGIVERLLNAVFRIRVWLKYQQIGVKEKYVDHKGYRFCYFSRGKPGSQPSMLMLHAFAFNKDTWLNIIEYFPKDIHLVCLDMPGHGKTSHLLEESYTVAAQAKRIHQFVKCIGLNRDPFHLVGFSLGGMVAGVYAAQYPSEVLCLSLLCPPGLRYPPDKDINVHLRKLQVSSNSQDIFKLGSYNYNKAKIQHLKGYFEKPKLHEAFFAKCFLDVFSAKSKYSLHDSMDRIKAPTQIIWGKDDKLADPSGATILANSIPNSEVYLLEKCGHFIPLDRPRKSANVLLEFYSLQDREEEEVGMGHMKESSSKMDQTM